MVGKNSPPMEKYIPPEIVEEILINLPVKSILRFKCVSKEWISMVESEGFIKKHLQYSTKERGFPNHKVIIMEDEPPADQRRRRGPIMLENMISLLNNNTHIDNLDLPSVADDPTNKYGPCSLVGCCNGLVCVVDCRGYVFLWNPTTRVSKKLPGILHDGEKHKILGFGCDEYSSSTVVYKVFAVFENLSINYKQYKVYSSETNSWKTLDSGPSSSMFDWCMATFACGKLHWQERRHGSKIVSFDLKSEDFGIMEKPSMPDTYHLWLGENGGCLSAVCYYDLSENPSSDVHVWVMKKESWFKLLTFPCSQYHNSHLITVAEGELYLLHGGVFRLGIIDNDNVVTCYRASIYVESLVSLPATETETDLGWQWQMPSPLQLCLTAAAAFSRSCMMMMQMMINT